MRRSILATTLLALVACGDDETPTGQGPDRGDAGSETGDGDATGTDASDVATLDTDGSGDTTVDTTPDTPADTTTDRDGSPVTIDLECFDIAFVADDAYRAADIIWVIDTSESMDGEIALVRQNVNNFVEQIADSGIDVQMVMVASKEDRTKNVTQTIPGFGEVTVPQSYHGVCVPPPLSNVDACPDWDNPPLFLHPDVDVYSRDALERLMIDAYPQFRTNLRPHARTHIVVVTDDSSSKDADWFRQQTRTVASPGFSYDYVFHSVVARGACGDGAGTVYESLSFDTGGVIQDVCQVDWTPVFDALLEGVVGGAELPCAYGLPEPEEGFVLNPREVNVFFTPQDGDQTLVYNVDGPDDCTDGLGWYYDDPMEPRAIYVCPSLCGDAALGTVDIAFGCETIKQ